MSHRPSMPTNQGDRKTIATRKLRRLWGLARSRCKARAMGSPVRSPATASREGALMAYYTNYSRDVWRRSAHGVPIALRAIGSRRAEHAVLYPWRLLARLDVQAGRPEAQVRHGQPGAALRDGLLGDQSRQGHIQRGVHIDGGRA